MIEVEIDKSDKKDKKLVAKFQFPDGKRKTTHFGAKGYSDFTSAGALSRWILWNEPDLNLSFNNYLARFSLEGKLKVKTSQSGHIPIHRE